MAPTPRQVELFHKLTTDRDFGERDVDGLKSTFTTLTVKAASEWIDRAMTLQKLSENTDGTEVAPDF